MAQQSCQTPMCPLTLNWAPPNWWRVRKRGWSHFPRELAHSGGGKWVRGRNAKPPTCIWGSKGSCTLPWEGSRVLQGRCSPQPPTFAPPSPLPPSVPPPHLFLGWGLQCWGRKAQRKAKGLGPPPSTTASLPPPAAPPSPNPRWGGGPFFWGGFPISCPPPSQPQGQWLIHVCRSPLLPATPAGLLLTSPRPKDGVARWGLGGDGEGFGGSLVRGLGVRGLALAPEREAGVRGRPGTGRSQRHPIPPALLPPRREPDAFFHSASKNRGETLEGGVPNHDTFKPHSRAMDPGGEDEGARPLR